MEPNYKVGLVCVSNIETLDEFRTAVKDVDLSTITGIDGLADVEQATCIIYGLDGKMRQQLEKGVNLVRETLKNGKTRVRKVVVAQ